MRVLNISRVIGLGLLLGFLVAGILSIGLASFQGWHLLSLALMFTVIFGVRTFLDLAVLVGGQISPNDFRRLLNQVAYYEQSLQAAEIVIAKLDEQCKISEMALDMLKAQLQNRKEGPPDEENGQYRAEG